MYCQYLVLKSLALQCTCGRQTIPENGHIFSVNDHQLYCSLFWSARNSDTCIHLLLVFVSRSIEKVNPGNSHKVCNQCGNTVWYQWGWDLIVFVLFFEIYCRMGFDTFIVCPHPVQFTIINVLFQFN